MESIERVLVVEDNPGDARLVRELLVEGGIPARDIVRVERLGDALATLTSTTFDAALLDLNLPDSAGLDTLRQLLAAASDLAVVVLTGLADEAVGLLAVEEGAQDYLIKDQVNGDGLTRSLRYAVERRRLVQERQHTLTRMRNALMNVVTNIARAIDDRTPFKSGHQQQVTGIAIAIAQAMALPDTIIETLRLAGLVHDVGMVAIPGDILCRPLQITSAEFKILQTHPGVGYELLADAELPDGVAEVVRQHHERLDGSGYPDGLCGDAIRLEARILAVADVLEAMLAPRAHRPAPGLAAALAELTDHRGSRYDPAVVDTCLGLIDKGRLPLVQVLPP